MSEFHDEVVTRKIAIVRTTPKTSIILEKISPGEYKLIQTATQPRGVVRSAVKISPNDAFRIADIIATEELDGSLDIPDAPVQFYVGGAMQVLDSASVKLVAQYTESSKYTNGKPLTNLSHTNVWYQIGDAAPVKLGDVAASAPSGGGLVKTDVVVAALEGESTTATFWAVATDTNGTESAPSTKVTFTVNRQVPEAPLNFTIG